MIAEKPDLDDLYLYGDVYEALDACGELESLLDILKRQGRMGAEDVFASRGDIARVRERLRGCMGS